MNNRAKIVTIASLKGGVGKTSLTSLLARYYAEAEDKKVLVVDFDSGAGITTLLQGQIAKGSTATIVEVLQDVKGYMDPRETYSRAVIHTDLENSPGWEKTGGSILLLPCKPALDDLFGKTDRNLLNAALGLLDLSDDFIILIDSGPDAINVVQAIASADIVFIPLQFSRQDVYPAVNTLRYIIAYQNSMSHPQFGGWVVIQPIQTQWEKEYMENFVNLFNTFQKNTGFICHGDNPFIHMKPSRIVHRGKHLTWSIRDEIFDPIREMAAVIDKTQTLEHTEA